MIHARELRPGNKVQNRQKEVITVQQILSHTLIYDTQIKVNREMALAGRSKGNDYSSQLREVVKEADYNDLEPITLTPKVLQKCGFRNFVREDWIYSIGNSHIDFEFTEDGLRLRNPIPSRVPIKYLHQLQNFLYAIAGHELAMEA